MTDDELREVFEQTMAELTPKLHDLRSELARVSELLDEAPSVAGRKMPFEIRCPQGIGRRRLREHVHARGKPLSWPRRMGAAAPVAQQDLVRPRPTWCRHTSARQPGHQLRGTPFREATLRAQQGGNGGRWLSRVDKGTRCTTRPDLSAPVPTLMGSGR